MVHFMDEYFRFAYDSLVLQYVKAMKISPGIATLKGRMYSKPQNDKPLLPSPLLVSAVIIACNQI